MFRKYSFSENGDALGEQVPKEFDWPYFENSQIEVREDSYSKTTKNLKSSFTTEEDDLLLAQVEKYGKKWKRMANFFPNKTHRMLRNRYLKLEMKTLRQDSAPEVDKGFEQPRKKVRCDFEVLERLQNLRSQIDLITFMVAQTKSELINIWQSHLTK